MAIELQVSIGAEITVGELRQGVTRTVAELTGNPMHSLAIWTMIDGNRKPLTDVMPIVGDGLIIVEAEGLDVRATLNIIPSFEEDGTFVCAVSAEYSRSAIELTLAAACSIWLARRSNAVIQDDWEFWTSETTISPDELMRRIGVRGVDGLDAACNRLVGSRVIDD